MKRTVWFFGMAVIVFCLGLCAGFAGTVDFSTIPLNGVVMGNPGSIVGWGYTLANASPTDWLVTTGLNADSFVSAVPNPIFDFPVLSPGSSVTVPYDPSIGAGLFELLWDSSAPGGSTNSGEFVLSSEWWTGDPLNGGTFIVAADDVSRPYESSVATPEPGTLRLVLGVGFVVFLRRVGGRVAGRGGVVPGASALRAA